MFSSIISQIFQRHKTVILDIHAYDCWTVFVEYDRFFMPFFAVKTIEEVIQRYKLALKSYRRCGSMKRAFEKQNVDRNMIARTAPIAELYIAFPDAFAALPEWNDSVEKMSAYAERCRQAITCDMAQQILEMKKKHLLLPTGYKLTQKLIQE